MVNPITGENALGVVVFHFLHVGNEVGDVDERLRCLSAGDDHFHIFRAFPKCGKNLFFRQQMEVESNAQFVEDDDVEFAFRHDSLAVSKGFVRHVDVGLFRLFVDKTAAAELFYRDFPERVVGIGKQLFDARFVVFH